MNRADIIRMARESGLYSGNPRTPSTGRMIESRLERFAALVAAAEREACAKVCEDTDIVEFQHCMVLHEDAAKTLRNAAAAIRARGNT